LTPIQKYARVTSTLPKKDKVLVQTHVPKAVGKRLDSLVQLSGRTRAGYLRHLIETHLRAFKDQDLTCPVDAPSELP